MKNSKARHTAGLGAILVAAVLAVRFLAVAVRRRSITAAVLAFTAAAGGLGVACALLAEACAPDSDGVLVTNPEDDPCESELFEDEEAQIAAKLMHTAFDVK